MAQTARLELGPEALRAALTEYFGFQQFRPGQAEIITAFLAGEDRLVVQPTGSGKSLCFQLPALLLPPLTIVVSPLIALMKDQVDQLNAKVPGAATYVNSSLPLDEQRHRLALAVEGRVKLLYVAPERFRFAGFARRLAETTVQRFVVDEAHCISQWGHDFRPDYLLLGDVLASLEQPPLLAATATATVEAQADIARQLQRPEMPRAVSGFNRPNLSFEVRYAPTEAHKLTQLARTLEEQHGSGIIYAGTRKASEAVAEFVANRTHRPTVVYHAGLASEERSAAQQTFMAEPEAIAVATNAFGMGIDKAEVRFVVHYALPGSLEAYYQEAGRAGRDGLGARCVLIYHPADSGLQEWFISNETIGRAELVKAVGVLADGCREPGDLADRCGLSENQARVVVSWLERAGLLLDRGGSDEFGRYELRRTRLKPDEIEEFEAAQHQRRRLREHQLGAMVSYAEMSGPRRVAMLAYFGDPTQPDPEQVAADDPQPPVDPEAVTTAESEAARRILETVAAARYGVGRQKIVYTLLGSKRREVDPHLAALPTFGSLRAYSKERLTEAVDQMVLDGWLKPVNGAKPVLALTHHGRAALADPERAIALAPLRHTFAPPPLPAAPPAPPSAQEAELFERLRVWRRELAQAEQTPPYVICHDAHLRALCQARPTTAAELTAVPGFGPKRSERLAESLLPVIAAWMTDRGPAEVPATPSPSAAVEPGDALARAADRLRAGDSLEAAARAAGLTTTALTMGVGQRLADGLWRPADVLGEAEAERIAAVVAARRGAGLHELRAALGQGTSLAAIRWVRQGIEPEEPAPSIVTAPLTAVSGPWSRGWQLTRPAAAGELADVLGAQTVALAVAAEDQPELTALLVDLSRTFGWPLLFDPLRHAARLRTPLLAVGRRTAVCGVCEGLRGKLQGQVLALLVAETVAGG